MGHVLEEAPLRDELRRRGLAIAHELTWDRTAERTIHVLAEVAGAGR